MKHPASRPTGLTLIELLVAIAIFALLGLMSYRAIHGATESQERLSEEHAAWQRINRALNRIDSEFTQIGVRMLGQTTTEPALRLVNAMDGSKRLVYWRMDATQGAKLSGIEWADGKISLLRWKTSDPLKEPTRDVLLEGVETFQASFAAKNATEWTSTWPVSSSRNAEAPTGIKIEFELAGKGRISRVFALR